MERYQTEMTGNWSGEHLRSITISFRGLNSQALQARTSPVSALHSFLVCVNTQ
jgi:hypothetical protein